MKYHMTIHGARTAVCLTTILYAAITCSVAQAASIVLNGGFEDPVVTVGQVFRSGGTSFGGWSVGGGSIDHTGSFWQAAEANQSVDLNGASAGSVFQDLPTVTGTSYMLSFAMAGNPFGVNDKRMQVSWGGVEIADLIFNQPGTSATSMNWTYHNFLISAVSDITRLEFVSLTGAMDGSAGFNTFYGPALDDVQVHLATVPLPAAVWLFGSGLLGLIGVARRKG